MKKDCREFKIERLKIAKNKRSNAKLCLCNRNLLCSKRSFELSFGMLFAIIAGAIIIFIAIYATTRFVRIEKYAAYSEAAKAIANLMNPVVSGITSAYATKIDFKKETRVYVNCSTESVFSPYFGRQIIAFSEESGIFKRWSEPGAEIARYNKYIFADSTEQGKKLYIFSKPFYLGFKVDDLIMLSMKDYCFVGAPGFVQEEIEDIGLENVNISGSIEKCKHDSVKVCFGFSTTDCNVSVYGECSEEYCKTEYDTGRIVKNGKTVYYVGSLIYAGIFSSPEIYECNVKRLGKKTAELGSVYIDKIDIVKQKECNTVIEPFLEQIIVSSKNIKSSSNLININYQAKLMDEQNCNQMLCKIYSSEEC